ncbi:MAG: hypothetical protein AB9861_15685 [Methanosarcina sp.]|jgi:hypothetical protein
MAEALLYKHQPAHKNAYSIKMPIIIAAIRFKMFLIIAVFFPKYFISRGTVTTPTIIKVVIKTATTA